MARKSQSIANVDYDQIHSRLDHFIGHFFPDIFIEIKIVFGAARPISVDRIFVILRLIPPHVCAKMQQSSPNHRLSFTAVVFDVLAIFGNDLSLVGAIPLVRIVVKHFIAGEDKILHGTRVEERRLERLEDIVADGYSAVICALLPGDVADYRAEGYYAIAELEIRLVAAAESVAANKNLAAAA